MNFFKINKVEILMVLATITIIIADYFVFTTTTYPSLWHAVIAIPSILIPAWWFGYFGSSKYVHSLENDIERQLKMTPETLEQLREHGVTDDTKLKLEFFFYSDNEDSAKQLTTALRGLDYEADLYVPKKDGDKFIITGWTTKMNMDDKTVLHWTVDMVKISYDYGADFDGWGTNPKQD